MTNRQDTHISEAKNGIWTPETLSNVAAAFERRSLRPPRVFGRYIFIAKLGHGGMAEVFLGYLRGLGDFRKLCVVKRLHDELEDEPGFVEMFLDEARLAAQLNHPNIVQTYEVGDIDQVHFISMEYLEGQSLDRIRKRCKALDQKIPPSIVAFIVMKVLEGLHYAHFLTDYEGTALNIVHRDVSPQNVFVTYEGAVKIVDFGIAKAASNVVKTSLGEVMGKFSYMAPEQGRGEPIDHRADIWSAGVLLWEGITGKRLFIGPNDVATLTKTLARQIIPLRKIDNSLPESLEKIVMRALERNRDLRYRTAQEMSNDLRQYLLEEAPTTGPENVSRFVNTLFEQEIEEKERILGQLMSAQPVTLSRIAVSSTPVSLDQSSCIAAVAPFIVGKCTGKSKILPVIVVIFLLIYGVVGFLMRVNFPTKTLQIAATPSSTISAQDIEPESMRCQVSFDSFPRNAKVLLAGRLLGTTPFEKSLVRHPPGKLVNFTFSLDGFEPVTLRSSLDSERMRLRAVIHRVSINQNSEIDAGEGPTETDRARRVAEDRTKTRSNRSTRHNHSERKETQSQGLAPQTETWGSSETTFWRRVPIIE